MTAAVGLGLPHFSDESRRLWVHSWVAAGVVDQVPRPGDVLPATIGDHGVHVLREPDGSLSAGYNAFQQGGCWTIPAQCGNGSKVGCAYVSCGHSRDGGELRAGRGGDDRLIRQVVGVRPGRRVRVPLATFGPLLFVALPGADDVTVTEQMPDCGPVLAGGWDDLPAAGWFRAEVACNWRHLGDVVRSVLPGDAAVTLGPPNLVVVERDGGRAVLVAKPVGPGRTEVLVARYGSAGDETGWRGLLRAAGRVPAVADSPVARWAADRMAATVPA